MLQKEYLFHLVQSLTRSEKRYFKLFCRGETAYLKLFEAISQQEEYDEAGLKARFENEPFVQRFHLTKIYLRDLILKSLRNYRQPSVGAQLKDRLRNIEWLYHKGLYSLCMAELKKADRLAEKMDYPLAKLDLLDWRQRVMQATMPGSSVQLQAIAQAKRELLNRMLAEHQLWEKQVKRNYDLPTSAPANLSLQGMVLWKNLELLQTIRSGQSDQGKDIQEALLDVLSKHPDQVNDRPHLYLSAVNNLVGFLIFQKEYGEAKEWIGQGHAFYQRIKYPGANLIRLRLRTFIMELEIYRDTRQFYAAEEMMQRILDFLSEKNFLVPEGYQLMFRFQFANIFFLQRKYDQALHWINELLNTKWGDQRLDLQTQSHFLNLIIHLELKNHFVLGYFVDSTRRFLKKRRKVAPYERQLLRFFSRAGKLPESELKSSYRDLYLHLFDNKMPLIPADVLDYIDYKTWLMEKL